MMVAVGFFCALPLALPIDPRQRMQCPKMNPSRVFTPEGQVSWGGSCMAMYNVESPGGYMPTGLSIPGVDILGFKKSYSPEKPWLFEDFDQITFYEVTEEEYEAMMAVFRSGRYEYEFEEVVFDMKEHNALLESTKEEVAKIRQEQAKAQEEMDRLEKELLEKWTKEKESGKISMDAVEELLNGTLLLLPLQLTLLFLLLTKIQTPRPRHHAHRSPPQRQRVESRGQRGRRTEKRADCIHPGSHEAGDPGEDGGRHGRHDGGEAAG